MHHLPLVLIATAVTLAGSAWYVPALQTLRAGQDRPCHTRLNAAACLAWWATGPAVVAALLFAPAGATIAALALGALSSATLRLRGAQVRRLDRRAHDRLWARLGETPTRPDPVRHRAAVVAWALAAVAVATLAVAALLATGSAPSAGIVATGLVAAASGAVAALTVRHRTTRGPGPGRETAVPPRTMTDGVRP